MLSPEMISMLIVTKMFPKVSFSNRHIAFVFIGKLLQKNISIGRSGHVGGRLTSLSLTITSLTP